MDRADQKSEFDLLTAADKAHDIWLDTYRILQSRTTTESEKLAIIRALDRQFSILELAILRNRKKAS